ncbi:MAG TPA: transporter [Flavobacteriaceae bacterium]|nr:transporter [Flavobacteriaceae bacterium]
MKKICIAIFCIVATGVFSQEKKSSKLWTSARPDGHAPISSMEDHTHHKGELMLSYRFMTMDMRHLRQNDMDATNANAFSRYMVAPQSMVMDMHMVGVMYATSDKLTLMAMANYEENTMDLMMKSGTTFSTTSNGFGDVSISGLYTLLNENRNKMHAQVGVNIPTGSIKEKDVTPMSVGNTVQLPYPMQTGTGSFGVKLGLTYLGQTDRFSWGNQLKSLINVNDNDQNYKFGNRYCLNSWFAARAGDWLSFSIGLRGLIVDKIKGSSDLLNPMMVTTADPKNYGGTFISSGFGANFIVAKGSLKGLRFATECSLPLYQNLNGIQLKQNYTLTFGTQYAFE